MPPISEKVHITPQITSAVTHGAFPPLSLSNSYSKAGCFSPAALPAKNIIATPATANNIVIGTDKAGLFSSTLLCPSGGFIMLQST